MLLYRRKTQTSLPDVPVVDFVKQFILDRGGSGVDYLVEKLLEAFVETLLPGRGTLAVHLVIRTAARLEVVRQDSFKSDELFVIVQPRMLQCG